ncbi:hypothetical protein ABIE65_002305 [Constrictibacter sp. MBR-5]|jgi:hypothetical protein
MSKDSADTYTDEEAQRRFEAALKAALKTPPKKAPVSPKPRKEGEQ